MYRRLAAWALGLCLLAPAAAHEPRGVVLPAHITVGGTPLELNGAGVRRYLLFEVYVGALYVATPQAQARAIIEAATPKCLYLHFLRDVRAERIGRSLLAGLRANVGDAGVARLQSRIDRLRDAIPDLRAGDRVRLEFPQPGRTRAWVNDALVADVDGREFQQAVLRFWLGERPTDERLKQALLGRDEVPQYAHESDYPGGVARP